jgi:predicted lipid-binding transport protein (Tim44 family)
MSERSHLASAGKRWRILLSLFFCLSLALAPSLAEARAGGSFSGGGKSSTSSMGSRGTRTFENNGAAPITRSMQTPNSNPMAGAPVAGAGGGALAGAGGGSFFQRHPFLTGLAGGFLGSALFSGLGGFGHVFGGMLQFLIIGLLIFLVIRLFTRGFSFGNSGPGNFSRMPMPASVGAAAAPSPNRFRGQDTTVGDADLNAFQSIHASVQEAWSRGDLGRLRQLMTPEMLSYFSEELTRNSSQGVQNLVSNVRLLKGDITESWTEGDLQYATAYLRWSAIDHVVKLGTAPGQPDSVVSGDPRTPTEAEEMWTFVRRRGANWLLSAIQQV